MIDLILSKLNKVHGRNGQYRAQCPSHGSKGLTLSIKDAGDGKTLVHCFAGCTAHEIMDSIGLSVSDLYPDDDGYQRPLMRKEERMQAEIFIAMARQQKNLKEEDRQKAISYARQLRECS